MKGRPDRKAAALIGARVRAIRLARGLSQTALGPALGLSFQQIQKYETGQNNIAAARLARIAAVLNVPLTDFYADLGPEAEESLLPALCEPGAARIACLALALSDQQRIGVQHLLEALVKEADGVPPLAQDP